MKTEMFHQQSFPNHLSARTAVNAAMFMQDSEHGRGLPAELDSNCFRGHPRISQIPEKDHLLGNQSLGKSGNRISHQHPSIINILQSSRCCDHHLNPPFTYCRFPFRER
jgi:hypothetical protein